MKEITIYAGSTIKTAWKEILIESSKCEDTCFVNFNGKQILSTDTLDEAYKKVTGKTKAEFEEEQRKWHEDYEREQNEFEMKIPKLTEEYRNRARGLIIESQLEYWDEIVPVRLGDLYHGMELEETLKACECMNDESMSYDMRLRKAYNMFMDAGHSGMSASLTASMYRRFVPNGNDLADAVLNFRFEEK
jgi:hypothetical protein